MTAIGEMAEEVRAFAQVGVVMMDEGGSETGATAAQAEVTGRVMWTFGVKPGDSPTYRIRKRIKGDR